MPTLAEMIDEVRTNLQGYSLRQDRITYVNNTAGLTTTSLEVQVGSTDNLAYHLVDLLGNDAMKNKILKQLELSVAKLTVDRNRKGFAGVVLTTAAEMANKCEDHIEYAHATELYALLDAKGFAKEVKA